MTIRVLVLLTVADQASFMAGRKPNNIIEHAFESLAQVNAYRDGIDAIADESDEVGEILVVESSVLYEIDGQREEVTFSTTDQASAFQQGLEDAEGFASPLIVTEDDDNFDKLAALLAQRDSTANK